MQEGIRCPCREMKKRAVRPFLFHGKKVFFRDFGDKPAEFCRCAPGQVAFIKNLGVVFAEDKHNEITITNPVTDASLPLSDMLITGTTTKNSVHHQGLGLTSIQKICSSNHIDFFGQREDESVSFSIAYEEA